MRSLDSCSPSRRKGLIAAVVGTEVKRDLLEEEREGWTAIHPSLRNRGMVEFNYWMRA